MTTGKETILAKTWGDIEIRFKDPAMRIMVLSDRIFILLDRQDIKKIFRERLLPKNGRLKASFSLNREDARSRIIIREDFSPALQLADEIEAYFKDIDRDADTERQKRIHALLVKVQKGED